MIRKYFKAKKKILLKFEFQMVLLNSMKSRVSQLFLIVIYCMYVNYIKIIDSLMMQIEILKQRTKDKELKKYCVSLLEKYGSFEYTKNKLMTILKEVTEEAKKFGSNPYMDELLETFYKLQMFKQNNQL